MLAQSRAKKIEDLNGELESARGRIIELEEQLTVAESKAVRSFSIDKSTFPICIPLLKRSMIFIV